MERHFGPGDLGPRGMRACLFAHRCGEACRKIGLKPLTAANLKGLGADAPHPSKQGRRGACSSSGVSAGWERLSESDVGSEWEKTSERNPAEFYAMSEGLQSSQMS